MPLFYQHNINSGAKIGVWHITEDESFFLSKVSLNNNITHWHKRLQHLAGRFLLQELFPEFPSSLIEIAETRKPFLRNEAFHFSISHCGDYAAAIVSRTSRVGIDIETPREKIRSISHKFLSEKEKNMVSENLSLVQLLTLFWSAKEAVFKWSGNGGVDFIDHIQLKAKIITEDEGELPTTFLKDGSEELLLKYKVFEPFILVWVESNY